MNPPSIPPDEPARLARLTRLCLLDTSPEVRFDSVVRLAQQALQVPIALISLVDADRQWFKAKVGLDVSETSRSVSFCGHAILCTEPTIIPDAKLDERFADNPLVLGPPSVRFYAGYPLLAESGQSAVGTLCVIDVVPRELSDHERAVFLELGRVVEAFLRQELELREKHDRARLALMASFPDRLFVLSSDGVFLDYHQPHNDALIVSPDRFLNRHVGDVLPIDAARAILSGIEACRLSKKPISVEYDLPSSNGVRSLQGRMAPLPDGLVVLTSRDVTEQRRMTAYLRESEAKFRRMFECSPVGMVLVGLDGKIRGANPAWLTLVGYSLEEIVGVHVEALTPPEMLGRNQEQLEQIRATGSYARYEKAYVTKSGALVPIELSGVVVEDGRGDKYIWSFVLDLTERKRDEAALAAARDAAEAATVAKSTFLAKMSHEIRTPMNVILGMSHLALDTALSEQQRDYVQKIDQASRSLLHLVDDILDFSKIEAGKLDIESIAFSPDEVARNALGMAELKAEQKSVELLVDLDPSCPAQLVGDPLRLAQILQNLLSNAVKFTERGEVELSSRVISSADDKVLLEFSVRDTGIGMSPSQLRKLFSPFAQADDSTTRKYGGTGLGLAICRQLSELMGGSIRVDSMLGGGSVFTVTLPFSIAEMAPELILEPALLDKRALVVGHGHWSRSLLIRLLLSWRMRAEAVANGHDAVVAVERALRAGDPFDLVLMKAKLPDADGVSVARRIRETGATCASVLTVSVSEERVWSMKARSEGLAGCVRRPILPSTLLDTLMIALGHAPRRPNRPAFARQSARFKDTRVLVVEDNKINREIATVLLEKLGVEVISAGDGAEALAILTALHRRVDERRIDLVLMDVQMPEMDGLTATREIRRLEGFTPDKLPILAMTAHAMSGDRQRSLDAGMNDHLTKPVDPQELASALLRWLPSAKLLSIAPESRAVDTPTHEEVDLLTALKNVGGDRELLHELFSTFASDYERSCDDVFEHLRAGRSREAMLTVHSVKGAGRTLGLEGVASAAESIENSMRNGASVESSQLDEFRNQMTRTLLFVRDYLSNVSEI